MKKLIAGLFRKRRAARQSATAPAKIDPTWASPGSFTVLVPHRAEPKPGPYDSPLVVFLTDPKADD